MTPLERRSQAARKGAASRKRMAEARARAAGGDGLPAARHPLDGQPGFQKE